MGPNLIKYEKQYNINGKKTMTKEQAQEELSIIKFKIISQLIDLEPILARGACDHLIEFVPESDPPILQWKKELLSTMDIGVLMGVKNLMENRKEFQIKRY